MSVECQVNVKSQSELDIGGRETCHLSNTHNFQYERIRIVSWKIFNCKNIVALDEVKVINVCVESVYFTRQ